MGRTAHGWQLVLFVGAIIVPSVVLVGVSQRTIQQNRELAGKRRLDERRSLTERVARRLLARLDALRRAPAQAPEVALVAAVEAGHIVPPWERDPGVQRFREMLARPGFGAAIERAERAEFAGRERGTAVRSYRDALAAARSPAQASYAGLLLARALEKQDRAAEAFGEARAILNTPVDLVDEDGVPLRVHAAAVLLASREDRARVREALRETMDARRYPSPIATFVLSSLADKLDAVAAPEDRPWIAAFRARIAAAIRLQEQVQALQNDAGRLGLLVARLPGGQTAWTYYSGAEPWLVAAEFTEKTPVRVIAVRARDALAPFERAAGMRFLATTEPGGELVGDSFPGLKALFPPADDTAPKLESGLYYLVLFLLVSATAFGAMLLWRSLRREMELAATRSQFVASVSHELKTPLTAIRMFAETLQMGRPQDESVRREYLETITNECDRLSRLVDDVLLFSKIEQGKKVFHARPVALGGVLRTAARTLSYPLAQRGFELGLTVDETVPAVQGDPDALGQAVLNLLSNAMKYSGESRRIDVRLARQNGEATIQVTDYGIGIEPAEQAHIFEKYYRATTPENRSIPGTGLGLTLVWQIVKAHHGRVEVKSAPGEGSTFTIRLPIGNGS